MTQFKPVLTKTDFVRRFVANEFGNRGPNWQTLEQFQASGYKGLVHLRSRIPGGKGKYNVPAVDVPRECAALTPGDYYLAGMAPHSHNLIQGELAVLPDYGGICLSYSMLPNVAMRDAFALGMRSARGIIAVCLLKSTLCPNSYDWLQVLLRRYPGHVVEFSCFTKNWGTIPGYNTVFWEVRSY